MPARRLAGATLAAALAAACGGSGGGGGGSAAAVGATDLLGVVEVERIVAQAVGEAQALGARAHVVVVDRSGNVLAAYSMAGAPENVTVLSGLPAPGGLETRRPLVPAVLAAISKALTGAYLSSHGNAFSTRTAGQIVQEHFNPNEAGAALRSPVRRPVLAAHLFGHHAQARARHGGPEALAPGARGRSGRAPAVPGWRFGRCHRDRGGWPLWRRSRPA
jgi:hypothetical protein